MEMDQNFIDSSYENFGEGTEKVRQIPFWLLDKVTPTLLQSQKHIFLSEASVDLS